MTLPSAAGLRMLCRPPSSWVSVTFSIHLAAGHIVTYARVLGPQESIRGCDVFLIQPTAPPVNDHLMELMVMIDACKRASARSITAVSHIGQPLVHGTGQCATAAAWLRQVMRMRMRCHFVEIFQQPQRQRRRIPTQWACGGFAQVVPYYGYARADRKSQGRESIAAKLTANIITEAGASRLLAMDLHSGQCVGYFDIPVSILIRQIKPLPKHKRFDILTER